MRFGWFLVVNFAGTIFAVLMLRGFGDVLGGPVDWLLDLFSRYTWQFTAGSVALVVLSFVLARIDVPSVDELEAELEGEPDPPEGGEPAPES
jgi:hypothetical protein